MGGHPTNGYIASQNINGRKEREVRDGEIIMTEIERAIEEIQFTTRETYIKILLNEYCFQCVTNTDNWCGLYGTSVREAIIIEKQVDEESDRRLSYIGNCKTRVCYRNTQIEFEEWMENNYG